MRNVLLMILSCSNLRDISSFEIARKGNFRFKCPFRNDTQVLVRNFKSKMVSCNEKSPTNRDFSLEILTNFLVSQFKRNKSIEIKSLIF